MSKKPVPAEKQQQEIYKSMTPALQQVANYVLTKKKQETLGVVRICYQIGEKINDVATNKDSYGEETAAIRKLADYTATAREMLYHYRTVVRAYPNWQDLEELIKTPMKDGNVLTITHMITVCQLAKVADRKKMLKRIINESLTANETRIEANANYDAKKTSSGGRRPGKPTSPQAGYQQMRNEAQKINNRFKQTWNEIFDEVDEAEPDKLDPALAKKCQEALSQFDDLEQHIMQSRSRIETNMKRIDEVVKQRTDSPKE